MWVPLCNWIDTVGVECVTDVTIVDVSKMNNDSERGWSVCKTISSIYFINHDMSFDITIEIIYFTITSVGWFNFCQNTWLTWFLKRNFFTEYEKKIIGR